MRTPALFLCCLLVLSACAAPVVKKQTLLPAPAAEVARLTRLRVAAFENDDAGQVRAAVESALASAMVDGRPYFTLLGASAPSGGLGKPMQWVDSKKPQTIRYGAEGLVQGNVDLNGWRDEYYAEDRSECVVRDDKGRCVRTRERHVQCVRRVAQFSFTPRVVAKDTGAVLLAQEFSETMRSSACRDKGSPASGSSLLAEARARAIARFRDHVAPHYATLDIPLLTDDDSGMSPALKAEVERGAELAKTGLTGKACTLWRKAASSHDAGFALPYLSGVCAELEDDLDRAEGFYALAEQRAENPVPEISAAFARLKDTRDNQDKLERQLK
ncbi:MAG: hypothetical protein KKF77_01420 [Proteobacteria bacterium]|nr:hypothetical protein [Pseudomonadota bacterium]